MSRVWLLLFLLALPCTAISQTQSDFYLSDIEEKTFEPILGTTYILINDVRESGILTGCEVEHSSIVRDAVYRAGSFSRIYGSITLFYSRGKQPYLAYKVFGADITLDASEKILQQKFVINYSYPNTLKNAFVGGEGTTFQCGEGAFCSGFWGNNLTELIRSILRNEISINYNREDGGRDVSTSLNLEKDDKSQDHILRFTQCLHGLSKRFEAQD
jgi:hypothetical protein